MDIIGYAPLLWYSSDLYPSLEIFHTGMLYLNSHVTQIPFIAIESQKTM